MKATEQGRVTPEMLDELERWGGDRDRKPWTMGVSSHVVAALVAEVREYRRFLAMRDALQQQIAEAAEQYIVPMADSELVEVTIVVEEDPDA